VFKEHDLRALGGDLAIGHVRYSTTGSNEWENSQPVHRSDGAGGNRRELALAHNGNLINAVELHAELREREVTFSSTSDSEIIAALLATHPADDIEDAIAEVMPRLQGRPYSTVVMTKKRVYAIRDPAGVRPLGARHDRRPLLRGVGDLRLRHHRRAPAARRGAGRARLDR
jgi:amidophosphoribosyltransferase